MNTLKNAVVLSLIVVATTAFAMPRNSYLLRPARTHADLISQIKAEPVVADRYQRHFGMNREEMIAYVESLKLTRLEKTGVYMVYGVPKNGVLHANPQLLKRGTLIWVDSTGAPILLEICGNPFTQGPKRTTMNDVISANPAQPDGMAPMTTYAAEPVVSAPVAINMTPTTPTAPQVEPVVESVSTSRPNFGWLALLPAVALIPNGGGGDAGPEPTSMVALALGAGTLISRRRKAAK